MVESIEDEFLLIWGLRRHTVPGTATALDERVASTVDRHITHIYRKIGRRGRVAAAAFALAHGLT